MTDGDFARTKRVVGEFLDKEGPELQKALEDYRQGVDSYIEKFWDAAYLEYTVPVVLNVNPIFVLEDDPTPDRNSQIARASSLVLSAAKFVQNTRQETLSVDKVRGTPLCMSQFKRLFATARLPVLDENGNYLKDKIETFDKSRHIVVLARNQFYFFDVVWEDGTVAVTEREIAKNLEKIIDDSKKKSKENASAEAVGVLTSEDRPTWASARKHLGKLSQANLETLRIIDCALFILCLDHNDTCKADEIAANLLHGSYEVDDQGHQFGSCTNRWYDKLQIVVSSTGNAGINFEHSGVDGHTVLRFASDVFTDTIIRFAQTISGPRVNSFIQDSKKNSKQGMRMPETRPRKLEFQLDKDILLEMRYAECRLSDMIVQNEIATLEFNGYGKQYIVSNRMSPDAFVQIGIMAAYYSMYGRLVNTYESVQTKTFLHGRTEAGRSATNEAKAFFEIFQKKGVAANKQIEALRLAIGKHSGMTRDCAQARGVDRHLYAMQCLFQEQHPDLPTPAIFADKGYSVLGSTVLSTSNCGNPCLRFFGFGPVSPQGFGIGYIIKDDSINFCVTSKRRQTHRYVAFLKSYFEGVQDMIISLQPPQRSPRALRTTDSGYGFFDSEGGFGENGFEEYRVGFPL